MEFLLNEVEVRVLGALVEKEITTPEYYPLSLNALVNACNQKSNREPVMQLEENTVRDALLSLHLSIYVSLRCAPRSMLVLQLDVFPKFVAESSRAAAQGRFHRNRVSPLMSCQAVRQIRTRLSGSSTHFTGRSRIR